MYLLCLRPSGLIHIETLPRVAAFKSSKMPNKLKSSWSSIVTIITPFSFKTVFAKTNRLYCKISQFLRMEGEKRA